MQTKTDEVSSAGIKHAIESRDGPMLASFYADDAILRIVDRNNPPSRPLEVKGRSAIDAYWDDLCSRAMTHNVEVTVAEEGHLAFTQAFCIALLELKNGKISRQTAVQAWDE
jgi:ketosteroid isomerase-like protein